MARAPKKAELPQWREHFADGSDPPTMGDLAQRIWVLEQSMLSGCKPYIAGGKAHCGVCQKLLADVYDTGCGAELDENCPHKGAE